MKLKKPTRRFRGMVPADGTLIEACRLDGVLWALFARSTARTVGGSWINLKLAADRAFGKANYWLSWAAHRDALTRVPDAGELRRVYPELYEWVADALIDYSRPSEHIVISDLDTGASDIVARAALKKGVILVSELLTAQTLYSTPIGIEPSVLGSSKSYGGSTPYICKGLSAKGLTDDTQGIEDLLGADVNDLL